MPKEQGDPMASNPATSIFIGPGGAKPQLPPRADRRATGTGKTVTAAGKSSRDCPKPESRP